MYDVLAQSPMFKGINSNEAEKLLGQVQYKIRDFSEGHVIYSRNEECNNLSIVLDGTVRGEMLDYSGKVLKIEDIEAPRPLAPAFLFGQHNRYPVDIVANNEVTLLIIPKESVLKMFQLNTAFLNNYLNAISNRAQFLSNRIWFLSFKTIKGKLAQYVLQLAQPDKTRIELPMTHQQLADFFGVTRPALSRAIGEMDSDGYWKAKRGEITILNRQALMQLVE
jgi:CRP/FNR family transcriptional regulator, dissimilatory nitrate respiration regulator